MIRVRQIKVNIDSDQFKEIKRKVAKKLNVKIKEIKNIKISKRSIDARDKDNIRFVYEVDVVANNENNICEEITYPRSHNVINGYFSCKIISFFQVS